MLALYWVSVTLHPLAAPFRPGGLFVLSVAGTAALRGVMPAVRLARQG